MSYITNHNSASNNNHQENNLKKCKGEHQGGFVSELHTVQKELYNPSSPLPEKWRIFLCIKHKILRNWERTYSRKGGIISHDKVMKETGVKDKSNFNRAIKQLVKEKMLFIESHEKGTFYQLHPERFGSDYIYESGRKKKHLTIVEEQPDILDDEKEESPDKNSASNIDQDLKDSSQDDYNPSQYNYDSSQTDYPPLCEAAPIAPCETQKSLQEPFQEPIQEGKIIDFKSQTNPTEFMNDWFKKNDISHLRKIP